MRLSRLRHQCASCALQRPRTDWSRGDGRGLRGDGLRARPAGRRQGPGRAVCRRRIVPEAFQAGGAGRRAALRTSARGHDLRRRRRATAVHRDGAGRQRDGCGPHRQRRRASRGGAALARADGGGTRRSARQGDRPSRRQARQSPARRQRGRARHRLRHRACPGRLRRAHGNGHRARDRRLPLAGAGRWKGSVGGERHLLAGRRRVRAPVRRPAVPPEHADRGGRRTHPRSRAGGIRLFRPPARNRPGIRAGACEGSFPAPSVRPRARLGAGGRARRRRGADAHRPVPASAPAASMAGPRDRGCRAARGWWNRGCGDRERRRVEAHRARGRAHDHSHASRHDGQLGTDGDQSCARAPAAAATSPAAAAATAARLRLRLRLRRAASAARS